MYFNRFTKIVLTACFAVLAATSCSKKGPVTPPAPPHPSLETNQRLLNLDINLIKDVVTTVERCGFAPSVSVNDRKFTLSGKTQDYVLGIVDETPAFLVFAHCDEEDKVWYWKYTASGGKNGYYLMNGEEKVPVIQKNTPLFRTDNSHAMEVSFDNGLVYSRLLDDDGDPIVLDYPVHSGLFTGMELDRSSELILSLANGIEYKVPTRPDQRKALEAIYDATDGDNWSNNYNWKQSDDISEWYGITCDGSGNVTKINLENNSLNGKLPDVFAAFPYCTAIDFDNPGKDSGTNRLTGKIPQSMATYLEGMRIDLRHNYFETTDFYVPKDRLEDAAAAFVAYPQRDYAFRVHINCDVEGTDEVRGHYTSYLRHKATEGKGIDIYIMGDGYTAENHTVGGVVDYWFEVTFESIFDIDPMDKLLKYFNVWYIYGHSPERGVSLFDNVRNSLYGYHQKNPSNESACSFDKNSIAKAIEKAMGGRYVQDGTSVMMVVNSTNNALYLGMQYSPSVTVNNTTKELSIAFVPTRPSSFRSLIHHEFVGHSFGRLRDEYGNEKSKVHSNPSTIKNLTDNVDIESNPNYCKWSDFYRDSRYASEEIDCYPGALNYSNVYRATKKSIMANGDNRIEKFNAPSRAGIYRKVMQRAYSDWDWDYETFVKFDLGL